MHHINTAAQQHIFSCKSTLHINNIKLYGWGWLRPKRKGFSGPKSVNSIIGVHSTQRPRAPTNTNSLVPGEGELSEDDGRIGRAQDAVRQETRVAHVRRGRRVERLSHRVQLAGFKAAQGGDTRASRTLRANVRFDCTRRTCESSWPAPSGPASRDEHW